MLDSVYKAEEATGAEKTCRKQASTSSPSFHGTTVGCRGGALLPAGRSRGELSAAV